jgi:hypothetical protein
MSLDIDKIILHSLRQAAMVNLTPTPAASSCLPMRRYG